MCLTKLVVELAVLSDLDLYIAFCKTNLLCLLRQDFESGMTDLEALTSASAGSRIMAALLARASVFWIPICCQDMAEPSVWMSIVDILEVTAESGSIFLVSETNSDLYVTGFQTVCLQCFMDVHQASSYLSKP